VSFAAKVDWSSKGSVSVRVTSWIIPIVQENKPIHESHELFPSVCSWIRPSGVRQALKMGHRPQPFLLDTAQPRSYDHLLILISTSEVA
jgi:hypothetical protein